MSPTCQVRVAPLTINKNSLSDYTSHLLICSLFLFPGFSNLLFPSWFFWWFFRATRWLFNCFLAKRLLFVTNYSTLLLFLVMIILWGAGIGPDSAVLKALASHQCGPGSIPGLGVVCGLSLLFVLVLAPRGFLQVLRFFPLLKNKPFYKISVRSGKCHQLVLYAKYIDTKMKRSIYFFNFDEEAKGR